MPDRGHGAGLSLGEDTSTSDTEVSGTAPRALSWLWARALGEHPRAPSSVLGSGARAVSRAKSPLRAAVVSVSEEDVSLGPCEEAG